MTGPAPVLLLAAIWVGLLAMERLAPLRRRRAATVPRLGVNLVMSALAVGTGAAVVAPAVSVAAARGAGEGLGLLPWLGLPPAAAGVAGFLLLDLSFYYWHRANHRFGLLWRFHNAHHVDPDLDVTTSLRFHFGEVGLSALFRVLQVGLLGVPMAVVVVYEACFQANTFFHHSNVRLPVAVERLLNLVLVTPRMHGIHHSQVQAETDSNYAVVLPWWDRLHRTLRLNVPQQAVQIGVAGYARPEDNRLWTVLGLPFGAQREYWPPGSRERTPPVRSPAPRTRLAE